MAGGTPKLHRGRTARGRSRSKRRTGIHIDMTPMVDIAFLLLIFYMTTTQFKPPEARAVDLPTSHSQIELPERDVITVTINKLDSVFVDWIATERVTIDGRSALSTVRFARRVDKYDIAEWVNRARGRNREALVAIKADKGAGFGVVQDIIRSLQVGEVERFLILTEPENDGPYAIGSVSSANTKAAAAARLIRKPANKEGTP